MAKTLDYNKDVGIDDWNGFTVHRRALPPAGDIVAVIICTPSAVSSS